MWSDYRKDNFIDCLELSECLQDIEICVLKCQVLGQKSEFKRLVARKIFSVPQEDGSLFPGVVP
jgi:hypothetical protein